MNKKFEVKFFDPGEGIQDAVVISLNHKKGDLIKINSTLLAVETVKSLVEIPSPICGNLAEWFVSPKQKIKVGDLICTIAYE